MIRRKKSKFRQRADVHVLRRVRNVVHTGKYLKQLKGKTDITPAFLLSCFKIWYSAYEHLDNAFGDRLNLPYRVMRHLTRTIIRFAHATCNNLNKIFGEKTSNNSYYNKVAYRSTSASHIPLQPKCAALPSAFLAELLSPTSKTFTTNDNTIRLANLLKNSPNLCLTVKSVF